MSDTNSLIKAATFDIISVIMVWGSLSNSNLVVRFNNKIYPLYTNLIGLGISTYILGKYIR
jgi:hypothetical protein